MHLLGQLVLGLAPAFVNLLGEQPCPDRASIEAELRLISPGITDSPSDASDGRFALIELEPKGLHVRLFDAAGHPLQDRFVEGSDTCRAWARIAAGLIATWEIHLGELHAAESHASISRPPPSPPPSPPPPSPANRPSPGRSRNLVGELGLGLGPTAALAGTGSTALGGEIFLGLRRRSLPIGGELGFATSAPHTLAVSGGDVAWERFAVSLGGYGTFGDRKLQLELGVAALGSLIGASTSGSLSPRSATTFDPGLGISTRLRWELASNWNVWLRGGTSLWLPSEILAGSPAVTTVELPSVDLFAMLGLSLVVDL